MSKVHKRFLSQTRFLFFIFFSCFPIQSSCLRVPSKTPFSRERNQEPVIRVDGRQSQINHGSSFSLVSKRPYEVPLPRRVTPPPIRPPPVVTRVWTRKSRRWNLHVRDPVIENGDNPVVWKTFTLLSVCIRDVYVTGFLVKVFKGLGELRYLSRILGSQTSKSWGCPKKVIFCVTRPVAVLRNPWNTLRSLGGHDTPT